ncbi:hypothetical protein OFY05_15720 [Pseudocitrobacter faecalis]|nr:hypothetical protein OFY05_15720 [Pseudocitrobacter faecalis]
MEKLITGYSGERKPIQTTLTSKYGLKEMVWSGDRFIQNGGAINSMGGSWQLLLPAYQPGPEGDNTYTLTAVAIDQKNNRSKPASVQVTVLAPGEYCEQHHRAAEKHLARRWTCNAAHDADLT